jgi:asparagine synthase (glutamine-hydrolysing)
VCGIAGIVGTAERERAPRMRLMREALTHRGPDSAGEYIDPRAALGVRRLRIIDLVTGDQPQSGEDGKTWTVFNGEIYNFQSLRDELSKQGHTFRTRSDTEVIVHLYERDGDAFVEKLDGMFAVAVWDATRRTLVLARDRLGKKPILLYETDGELSFASEHQALIAALGNERLSADRDAIALYLRLGYVPAPFDAFTGIRKLEAGTVLVWRDGKSSERRYWQPPRTIVPVGEDEAIANVRILFDRAVQKRLVADVPIGAFLSGGVDSSALVASMAAQSKTVRTFTIGFEDEAYSEVQHARRIAQRYGTDHHEFVVRPDMTSVLPLLARHYGEPYADSSAVPTYYLSKLTRDLVTVALAGDGGDELFAGYQRYHAVRIAAAFDRIPERLRGPILGGAQALLPKGGDERRGSARLRRFIVGARRASGQRYLSWLGITDDRWLAKSATPEFRPHADSAAIELERRAAIPVADAARRAQLLDLDLYLPDDLLVKVDIASMANSLEVRAPFLDRCLVEYALQLPTSLMIRGTRRKWVLRKAFADTLPAENLARRKQGFGVPIGRWLREDLRPLLADLVLSAAALQRGYLRPDAIRALIDEHLAGADHSHRLWSLLMLELWHREFAIA